MRYIPTPAALAVAALVAMTGPALSDAAGVGVGVTGGTYSATAASGALTGNIIATAQIGTFSQTAGTRSAASAGMAIGVNQTDTLSVSWDGIDNGSIGLSQSSSATLEGFGTANSVSAVAYEGNGGVLGLQIGGASSTGAATSAGAFLGVGAIGAVEAN